MDRPLELMILTLSILFFISILATKASAKSGVPVLVLFLGVGMIFGGDGFGFDFNNLHAAEAIGTVALSLILFSGGMDTHISDIKPVMKPGITLATVGVIVATLLGGVFIWVIANLFLSDTNFTIMESLLLAAIMSSTDSASVFNILRGKGILLKNKLGPLLELESGSNDPMAYMLTVTFISLITSSVATSLGSVALTVVVQLVVGVVSGYLVGKLCVKIINKINLTNDSLYPILLFTCCLFSFSFTYFIKGNGFLAVYISGLVMGNSKFASKKSSMKFFDGLAWFSQIIMFLTLGLLARPHELLYVIVPSFMLAGCMIFIVRPVSTFISMKPYKYSAEAIKFVSWGGLRGAVPIVFAILPLVAGMPNGKVMFNIVFFVTLISLLLQGSSLTWFANKLKLIDDAAEDSSLKSFDLEFNDSIKSAMSEISITAKQLEKGNHLMDMDLPDKTLVVMVKRGNNYFIPKGLTEIQTGDTLLVISDDEDALRETYQSMGISKYHIKKNG